MIRRALLLAALCSAASCSFTTATGFNECETDLGCAVDQACLEHYCIKLTPGCRRELGVFDTPNRIAFAAILPLTDVPDAGTVDQSEQQGLNALALALEEGNQRDGIKGKKFALFTCNSGGQDTLAKQQADWMATQLKVPAVITSGSGQSIAVANVVTPKDVLVMSATSTSPELIGTFQTSKGLVWRTAPPDTFQARVLADQIEARFSGTAAANIGILYVNTTYGQGLSGALRPLLTKAQSDGGVSKYTVKEVPYAQGEDVAQPVADLESFFAASGTRPRQTVLVGFPPDIRRIISLTRTKVLSSRDGGNSWLFTDSAKDPAILEDGGLPELAGSLGTAPAQGDGSSFGTFQDRFKAKFPPFDPANFAFTSHSYDAMYLLMAASAWSTRADGGLTGPGMADGLRHMSSGAAIPFVSTSFTQLVTAMQAGTSVDVEGTSGKLNFDLDAGAPPSRYELWKIEPDAGFSLSALVDPSGT